MILMEVLKKRKKEGKSNFKIEKQRGMIILKSSLELEWTPTTHDKRIEKYKGKSQSSLELDGVARRWTPTLCDNDTIS